MSLFIYYFFIFIFYFGMLVSRFVCMFVSTFWVTILEQEISLFFPIILSLGRIEKDQISTKSVAFSHSYDHFSYSE